MWLLRTSELGAWSSAGWTNRTSPGQGSTTCFARADPQDVTPNRLEALLSPMALLESGIPLSLLFDLVYGPQSADLLSHERDAED